MDRLDYHYGDQPHHSYPHHQTLPPLPGPLPANATPTASPLPIYPTPEQPSPVLQNATLNPASAPAPAPTPASLSPPKKRRRGITDDERKALRDYFHENGQSPTDRPSQKHLQSWFSEKFDHKITQSSISTILSPAYAHLDTQENLNLPQKMKKRNPDWPDLEEALFEWQSILSKRGVTVSGEMLKEEAGRLWRQLPKYRGPNGQMDGSKRSRIGIGSPSTRSECLRRKSWRWRPRQSQDGRHKHPAPWLDHV